jgi:hypothetical protein
VSSCKLSADFDRPAEGRPQRRTFVGQFHSRE